MLPKQRQSASADIGSMMYGNMTIVRYISQRKLIDKLLISEMRAHHRDHDSSAKSVKKEEKGVQINSFQVFFRAVPNLSGL